MSNVQYYVPLKCNITNPEDVGLFFQMGLRGLLISRDVSIEVSHGGWIDNPDHKTISVFHRIDGVFIEGSSVGPFRKITLCLEGTLKGGKTVFALLEYNPKNPKSYSRITLSPVPFVQNNWPKLPYDDEQLRRFLLLVKTVLLHESKGFEQSVLDNWALDESGRSIPDAKFLKDELERLAIIRLQKNRTTAWESTMLPQHFERTFGVKLP
jgi:hypothetical protein